MTSNELAAKVRDHFGPFYPDSLHRRTRIFLAN